MSSGQKNISKFLYFGVPIAAALITGSISSIPWLYDRFIAQDYNLAYSAETPIPMNFGGESNFVQVVTIKNEGRRPLSDVVANFTDQTKSITTSPTDAPPHSVNDEFLNLPSLFPGELIRATVVTQVQGLTDNLSVRSKEVSGVNSIKSTPKNQTWPTILFAAGGSLFAAMLAMLFLRRKKNYYNRDDPNLILLVASLFQQKYLMELVWDVRYHMKYRGAADFILMGAVSRDVNEQDLKALLALCADPNQDKRDRYEIAYYISRLTGKDLDFTQKYIDEKITAKSGEREDTFTAIWRLRDDSIQEFL